MKHILQQTTLYLLIILIISATPAFAQRGQIKGKVITSDSVSAEAVHVNLDGTDKGTVTDEDGNFEIHSVKAGDYKLIVSFVGMESQAVNVHVKANETTVVPGIVLHERTSRLDEIIVSDERINFLSIKQSDYVSKVPLKSLENSQAYSTITADLMKQQLVFSVDDAVKNAPGLQKMWEATGRGGDGGAYYNARGFILQSQLRNGVAGNVTSRIDAVNVERIEVIKGPSATLFGSTLTSYGGLINRVTKKPYDKFGGEVSYSAGSYGFNRISGDVNIPLSKEKDILFRLNTAYHYEGSFQDNGFEKGYVVAPSLSYQINDRLSLSLDAEWYSGSNTSKQMIFFYFPATELGETRADQLGIDYRRTYSSNDIFQVSESSNFFLQLNYKISNAWISQTNFTTTRSFSDGPYAYFYLIPNYLVTGNPSDTGSDYLVRADQSTANSEIHVTGFQQNFVGDFLTGGVRHRLVVGLDLYSENSNQFFYGDEFDTIPKNGFIADYTKFNRDKLDSVLTNGSPWTWPYRYKTHTYSAYISDVINLSDKLIASAGIRLDRFDNKGSFDQTSGQYFGDYKQTTLSPRFGLVYQIVPDKASFFANYQNGFTNQTGLDYKGNTFKPEQANQWEGGIKLDIFRGKLNTTISYYHIQVQDIVRPFPENPNFSIQDGTQLSEGIETEVIVNPVKGLNAVAGFSYNDSKFQRSEEDVTGLRPSTAMSPVAANLWVSYWIQQGTFEGFGVGIGGNYASDNKILNSKSAGEFILPACTILNVALFYDRLRFRAAIKMDNLTDKEYWIGYTTMNPQKLRSITGSLSIKF